MDSIANYNESSGSQLLPETYQSQLPEFSKAVEEDGFKGDFIGIIGRKEDQPLYELVIKSRVWIIFSMATYAVFELLLLTNLNRQLFLVASTYPSNRLHQLLRALNLMQLKPFKVNSDWKIKLNKSQTSFCKVIRLRRFHCNNIRKMIMFFFPSFLITGTVWQTLIANSNFET